MFGKKKHKGIWLRNDASQMFRRINLAAEIANDGYDLTAEDVQIILSAKDRRFGPYTALELTTPLKNKTLMRPTTSGKTAGLRPVELDVTTDSVIVYDVNLWWVEPLTD